MWKSTLASSTMSTETVEAPPAPTLTVGDVAAHAGVAPSAVRFYEKHGLVRAERTAGNQRRFPLATPCVIRIAKVAQRVGLTVREITAVFDELPDDPDVDDFLFLERTLVAEAEARIAVLKQVLADLGSGEKLCELAPGS